LSLSVVHLPRVSSDVAITMPRATNLKRAF
jgi:hypothetical protein